MTELEKNLNLIKNELQTKLIPENINKGVNIFGVEGNYVNTNYTELEYIESTGTQYIDTGYVISNECIAKYGFMITGIVSDGHPISGVYNGNNNDLYFGIVNSTDSKLSYKYGDTFYPSTTTIVQNTAYDVEVSLQNSNQSLKINNSLETTSTDTTTISNNATLNIFSISNLTMNNMIGRIYYYKLYDNGILVRDYIPVIDPKGNICLFDKVSQSYFYNQGTGDFIAGNVI